MDFPKIKKKVVGFLLNEDGKISKQAAIIVGGAAGVAAIGYTIATIDDNTPRSDEANCDMPEDAEDYTCWAHNNGVDPHFEDGVLKTNHQHHYNHTNSDDTPGSYSW